MGSPVLALDLGKFCTHAPDHPPPPTLHESQLEYVGPADHKEAETTGEGLGGYADGERRERGDVGKEELEHETENRRGACGGG